MASRLAFLTHHTHVLESVARSPCIRARDIAAEVGLTERAVLRLLAQLIEAGYLIKTRQGRGNRYEVRRERAMQHPLEADRPVGAVLSARVAPPLEPAQPGCEPNT